MKSEPAKLVPTWLLENYRTHVEGIPEDRRWNEHRIILRLIGGIDAQQELIHRLRVRVDELVREDSVLAGDYTILRELRDLLTEGRPDA